MKNSKRAEYPSALKGKVKCGCCGYSMSIKREVKKPYYRCSMGKGCGSYTKINVELLETIVWNVLQKFMETYHEQKNVRENERMQEVECQRKLELLNQYLAESLAIQNIAEQKSELVVLAETQGLTEELVDGLIERIEVYSDERVEIKWKVRDVIE